LCGSIVAILAAIIARCDRRGRPGATGRGGSQARGIGGGAGCIALLLRRGPVRPGDAWAGVAGLHEIDREIAIEIEPHFAEEAKKHKVESGRDAALRQHGKQGDGKMSHDPIVARDQAAKSVGISGKLVSGDRRATGRDRPGDSAGIAGSSA